MRNLPLLSLFLLAAALAPSALCRDRDEPDGNLYGELAIKSNGNYADLCAGYAPFVPFPHPTNTRTDVYLVTGGQYARVEALQRSDVICACTPYTPKGHRFRMCLGEVDFDFSAGNTPVGSARFIIVVEKPGTFIVPTIGAEAVFNMGGTSVMTLSSMHSRIALAPTNKFFFDGGPYKAITPSGHIVTSQGWFSDLDGTSEKWVIAGAVYTYTWLSDDERSMLKCSQFILACKKDIQGYPKKLKAISGVKITCKTIDESYCLNGSDCASKTEICAATKDGSTSSPLFQRVLSSGRVIDASGISINYLWTTVGVGLPPGLAEGCEPTDDFGSARAKLTFQVNPDLQRYEVHIQPEGGGKRELMTHWAY